MLSSTDSERLCSAARLAAGSAYCPYSNYPVGAALLLKDGSVVSGCNVENISLGLSLCAERAAIATAVAGGMRFGDPVGLAVCGGDRICPITPCGACRQVLAEFAAPDCQVLCFAPEERLADARCYQLSDLLPEAFRLK